MRPEKSPFMLLEDKQGKKTRSGTAVRVGCAVIAGLLLGWSLVLGYAVIKDCEVTREWDVMRDISIAQALFDGRYPEDPILLGEISWYNPLTGVILAALSRATGQPLMRLGVTLGPFINLLSPVAFYVFASCIFGRAAALAGLCLMLFGKEGRLPFWTCAYSPWLLAPMYSLGLFFLLMVVGRKAVEARSAWHFHVAGILLGVTFMGHTAPAVVAGGTILLMVGIEAVRLWLVEHDRTAARRVVLLFVLMLAVAFIISLPYSGPIMWRYQFRVLNPWPSLYASQNVELQNLPEQIRLAFCLRNGIALLTCSLLVQHYVWQALRLNDVVMTSIVPGHHAAIQLASVRTVLFGAGVVMLGMRFGRVLQAAGARLSFPARLPLPEMGAAAAVLLSGVILYVNNPYHARMDFIPPDRQTYHDLFERQLPMYEWIRDNTPPEAVFLCPDESMGMLVVMPAGRKLVNPMLLYSNPYVDRGVLTMRQEALLRALENNDSAALCEAASPYPHLFLLVDTPDAPPTTLAVEVHRAGGLALYEVDACWRTL